jgi:hypothetical protein
MEESFLNLLLGLMFNLFFDGLLLFRQEGLSVRITQVISLPSKENLKRQKNLHAGTSVRARYDQHSIH